MNYAALKTHDVANGPGIRVSLFVSGCTHRCPGCFNDVAWDFGYGQEFTPAVAEKIMKLCEPDYVAGLSILGGEPFELCNQRELLPLLRRFRLTYPEKSIWVYSGYLYEELTGEIPSRAYCETTEDMLSCIDVLVDGEYVEAEHDISLHFRGSKNQRIIDLEATRAAGEIVLHPENDK